MEVEMKDPKTGKSGTTKITTDTWVSSEVSGYDQVRAFYKKMGEKINWTPGSGSPLPGVSDMAKGMEQVAKEMAKLDGVPVLQVVKMGAPGGQGMPQMTPEQQAQMASAQQQADASRAQQAARLRGLWACRSLVGSGRRNRRRNRRRRKLPQHSPRPLRPRTAILRCSWKRRLNRVRFRRPAWTLQRWKCRRALRRSIRHAWAANGRKPGK